MRLQQSIPLSDIYRREEDFSEDLAGTLDALKIGSFEDAETESNVGTRRSDIVAVGADGTLVIENQIGKADWDHWGRLEAYARLKGADVAALVAEDFEELMIVTCNLRNEESNTNWYLIQVKVNSHKELSFHHVARPAIDIQTEKQVEEQSDLEYKEFWTPILQGELNELFATGKPNKGGWLGKTIRDDIEMWLRLTNRQCYILLYFDGENSRKEAMASFSESDYDYDDTDTSTETRVKFPVLNKGKNNRDDWPEIREKLVNIGTDIYNRINESNM